MDYNWKILKDNYYLELCNYFYELAKNEEDINILKSILNDGCFGKFKFATDIRSKDNAYIEELRRISMAYLYINNPATFKYFVDNKINVFHGTNINALPSILKYGMNSVSKSNELGIDVKTGETWSRDNGNRNFISFTNVLEIAQGYASMDANAFEVIICTDENEINNRKIVTISSDLSEIGIDSHFPLESIKCICVPEEKVDYVKRMIGDLSIDVLGLSNLYNKFYYQVDMCYIEYNRELFEEYKTNKNKKEKKVSEGEILEVVKSRKLSGIKKIVDKFKGLIGLLEAKDEVRFNR